MTCIRQYFNSKNSYKLYRAKRKVVVLPFQPLKGRFKLPDRMGRSIWPTHPISAKLSLSPSLALFLLNPATLTRPEKFIFQQFSGNVDQVTLQEYIRTPIGRRPKYFRQMEDDLNFLGKWKTTSILRQIGKQPKYFRQMEDDLNFLSKWKTTSTT